MQWPVPEVLDQSDTLSQQSQKRHLRALPAVPSRRLVTLRFHLKGGGYGVRGEGGGSRAMGRGTGGSSGKGTSPAS